MATHMQMQFNPPPKMFLAAQVLYGFKITNKISIISNEKEVTCKRCLRDLRRIKQRKGK